MDTTMVYRSMFSSGGNHHTRKDIQSGIEARVGAMYTRVFHRNAVYYFEKMPRFLKVL